MQIVKTALEIRFTDAYRPWLELRNLLRIITDDPKAELKAAPVVVERPKRKQRIAFQARAFALEQDALGSPEESVPPVLELVSKMSEASPPPTVLGIRYDAFFIEPYSLPFHELVVLIKDRYLRRSTIADQATDVSLSFDLHEGETVKHLQIGPMEAAQLRAMYLKWPPEVIPERFVFLALGYERNKESAFSSENVRAVLEAAIQWQVEEARRVFGFLREGG